MTGHSSWNSCSRLLCIYQTDWPTPRTTASVGRRFEARAWITSIEHECWIQIMRMQPTKHLHWSGLIQPFLLQINQLRQFIAINPVLLHDFSRVHLVVKCVMLCLTVQATQSIIVLIVIYFIDLVWDLLFCINGALWLSDIFRWAAKDPSSQCLEYLNALVDYTWVVPRVLWVTHMIAPLCLQRCATIRYHRLSVLPVNFIEEIGLRLDTSWLFAALIDHILEIHPLSGLFDWNSGISTNG